jgi:hypothetical protein
VATLPGLEEIKDIPVACPKLSQDGSDFFKETFTENHIILEDQDVFQFLLLRLMEEVPVR